MDKKIKGAWRQTRLMLGVWGFGIVILVAGSILRISSLVRHRQIESFWPQEPKAGHINCTANA
jgi:hypothetical protein